MRRLIEHVAKYGMSQTLNEVPLEIQHQLIAEDQQRHDQRAKQAMNSDPNIRSPVYQTSTRLFTDHIGRKDLIKPLQLVDKRQYYIP
jgi:hypothetical protein